MRTITGFEPRFNASGTLLNYRAEALIWDDELFTEPSGQHAAGHVTEWYAVPAEELPPAFVSNLETKRAQVATQLDERYPMPVGTQAARAVIGFTPSFSLDGGLLAFSVRTTIETPSEYVGPDGETRRIRFGRSYTVGREGLPTGFVSEMETIRNQTQAKIDELY